MKPFCICLLLFYTSVLSHPTNYQISNRDSLGLSNEFWMQHFGSDFQDAIHMTLGQTGLINDGNRMEKHLSGPADNTRKRSPYIVHTPKVDMQANHALRNSMKVHLLRPDEIEQLEKQIQGYGNQNKMAGSPVLVNLPGNEAAPAKSNDDEAVTVPKSNPFVYQNNMNTFQPQYWPLNQKFSGYPNSLMYSQKMINPQMMPYSYMNLMQPSFAKPPSDKIQPAQPNHDIVQPVLEITEPKKDQSSTEAKQLPSIENTNQKSESSKEASHEEVHPVYEDSLAQSSFEKIQAKLQKEQPSSESKSSDEGSELPIDKTQPSLEHSKPSPEVAQASIEKTQLTTTEKIQPPIEKSQPSIEKPKPSLENLHPFFGNQQPSFDKSQPFFEKIHSPFDNPQQYFAKPQSSFEKLHSSFEKPKPSFEKPQFLYQNLQPFLKKPPSTFSYPKMTSLYTELNKPNSYLGSSQPMYDNKALFSYGSSMLPMYPSQNKTFEQLINRASPPQIHEKKAHEIEAVVKSKDVIASAA